MEPLEKTKTKGGDRRPPPRTFFPEGEETIRQGARRLKIPPK